MPCVIEHASSCQRMEQEKKDLRELGDLIASSKVLVLQQKRRSLTVIHYPNTKPPFNTRGQGN